MLVAEREWDIRQGNKPQSFHDISVNLLHSNGQSSPSPEEHDRGDVTPVSCSDITTRATVRPIWRSEANTIDV